MPKNATCPTLAYPVNPPMTFHACAMATNMKTSESSRCVPGSMTCCTASIAANAATRAIGPHELDSRRVRAQSPKSALHGRRRPSRIRGRELSLRGSSYLDAPAVLRLADQSRRPDEKRDDQHGHRDRVDPRAGQ